MVKNMKTKTNVYKAIVDPLPGMEQKIGSCLLGLKELAEEAVEMDFLRRAFGVYTVDDIRNEVIKERSKFEEYFVDKKNTNNLFGTAT